VKDWEEAVDGLDLDEVSGNEKAEINIRAPHVTHVHCEARRRRSDGPASRGAVGRWGAGVPSASSCRPRRRQRRPRRRCPGLRSYGRARSAPEFA
jgi:hypothetical protein